MLRTAIVLFISLFGAGCFGGLKQQGTFEPSSCAQAAGAGSGQPLQTPALVERGNVYLESALHDLARSDTIDVATPLRQSSDCFGRALRLTPDSYEAQLSMSVAYLARARLAAAGSADRTSLLDGARFMLGRAYMLRHGAYEALYYLAEVAVAEGRRPLARRLLEPLRLASVKDGPVNMLLGSLAEGEGKTRDAEAFYRKAVAAGWPTETLIYAAARLRELEAGGHPRKDIVAASAGGR